MARPLRVDVENGWYHVTSRGIERRSIFENDAEHVHFLGSGMTLGEVGGAVGGMDYTAVAMAIKRFERRADVRS